MCASIMNQKHFLLDIETSGLNRNTDYVVCIGVSFITQNKTTNHQWMIQHPEEEKQLLSYFIEFAQDFSHVYTYSGKHFDWPFLLARCAFHNLDLSHLQQIYLIDMKKTLQHFGATRAHIEDALGIVRHSTTSGKELAKVYKTYQTSGEMIYKKLILNHNQEELTTLQHFYELYHTLYHLNRYRFNHMTELSSSIKLSFETPFTFYTSFNGRFENMIIYWKKDTQLLTIEVGFAWLNLKHYLTPYKDYYYIPSQNQLLHRTLASFIAASDKRKASKEECTLYKEDNYIPIYTTYKLNVPIWYDSQQKPYLKTSDFSPALLVDQLFYLLFSNQKTS